jgi:DnaJ-class molecular chaperone
MQFEAILMFLLLVVYMICAGIKALFRLVTGEAQREREEEQRQENERRRREKEREQEEAAKRQAKADAKKQFEQSVMQGQFPSGEVLSAFSDFESECEDIPTNVKEAFEELLYGSCTLRSISYGEAVRLIRQHGRIGERARQRTARVGLPGDDPDRPLGEAEALALLGVAPGCTADELAHAYHQKMSQWHPDKLETMAPELKDYATRQTQRINEAYQKLKPMAAHRVRGE